MSNHPSRIWEAGDNSASPSQTNGVKPTQLPSIATLTNPPVNNPSSPNIYQSVNRTSDPWRSNPQSTRSSAYSSGFGNGGYSSSITSPHRASNSSQLGATSYPAEYQNGHHGHSSGISQASPGFAPPHHSSGLPAINQHQQDPSQYRDSHEFPSQDSRRSSLGSQVNKGFGNLQINSVSSPYTNSPQPSQSSITVSLQRERGIPQQTNGVRNSGTSSIHQPLSPLGPYPGESRQAYSSRTAPIISANPIKEVYNAENPTAGQPYAFPDPDMPPSNRSSGSAEGHGSTMLSRRNSGHTSITSSIVTNDSKLPIGQHRLDEDIPDVPDMPDMPGTHHHSLQNKHMSNLSNDPDSPNDASSPYSRTPALRASHKMAERKRRTEMKSLFDQLRSQIPASHGNKSSKWEILSKASEHIKNMETAASTGAKAQIKAQQLSQQMDEMRRQMETMQNENYHLSQEMQHYREQTRPQTATAMHPQQPAHFPSPSTILGGDPSRSLPPLTNGTNGTAAASSSMQGVQYTEERR